MAGRLAALPVGPWGGRSLWHLGGCRGSGSAASTSVVDEAAVERLVEWCRTVAQHHGMGQQVEAEQVAAHVRVLLAEGVGEAEIQAVIRPRRPHAAASDCLQQPATGLLGSGSTASGGGQQQQLHLQRELGPAQAAARIQGLLAAGATLTGIIRKAVFGGGPL